jgi:adenylylsulfate kinase
MNNSTLTLDRSPMGQERDGLTVWFTGLSGAGKTTICDAVSLALSEQGYRVEVLDGDVLRQQISRDLGFGKEDRDENVRRIAFIAEILTRNGILVLVAAISPYRRVREEVREKIGRFLEVFVDAPLAICEERDPKGLYRRARRGELKGFTGIDDPYEAPHVPDVRCRTDRETLEISSQKVISAVADYFKGKTQSTIPTR